MRGLWPLLGGAVVKFKGESWMSTQQPTCYDIRDLATRLGIGTQAAYRFAQRIHNRGIGRKVRRVIQFTEKDMRRAAAIYEAGRKYHGAARG